MKGIFTKHCTAAKGGTADVPELRFAIEAQLRGEDPPSASSYSSDWHVRGQRPTNCSLRSSTGEMPLPVKKREDGRREKAISWESWGLLILALVALGSQAFPMSAAGCPGRPPAPIGWRSPWLAAQLLPSHWKWRVPAGSSCDCCCCSCTLNSPIALEA